LSQQAAGYHRPALTTRKLIAQLGKIAPAFAEAALALIAARL
jgi:hypothetical protein